MAKKIKTVIPKSDVLCINTIRTLAMDAIQAAKSGHPGAPMGMAPAAYVLWTRIMKHNPRNPEWINRDRFVLSAGHASMLLYSLLYLCGYGLTLEDIKNFRVGFFYFIKKDNRIWLPAQSGSKLPFFLMAHVARGGADQFGDVKLLHKL